MHQDFTNAQYDSIAAFCDAVELTPRVAANKTHHDHFLVDNRDSDWYGAGCHDGRAVLQAMRDGWTEGRDRMNQLRDKLTHIELTPRDRRRRIVRGPQGDTLDMFAVWAGRFDTCWKAPRRLPSYGPQRIDIVANMICSGGEHSDVLFYRGAAAAVLADMLEQAGYMVRLTVNFGGKAKATKGESKSCSCRIVVKDHGQPFDVTSVSAVILPGFFRALGHAWIANHAPYERNMGGIAVGQGKVESHEILISHAVRDHATAVALIEDTLRAVNEGSLQFVA